jgi:lipoyl-dependent peroxiredoxin
MLMNEAALLGEDNVLYTARTHTIGGREGRSRSDDGHLAIILDRPGTQGMGTNPEQLFAAGWSACFGGAMAVAARGRKLTLPADTSIDAEVDLRQGASGYSLAARLQVRVPGMDPATAQKIVDEAHEICPYSKATRGNIDVSITLI